MRHSFRLPVHCIGKPTAEDSAIDTSQSKLLLSSCWMGLLASLDFAAGVDTMIASSTSAVPTTTVAMITIKPPVMRPLPTLYHCVG